MFLEKLVVLKVLNCTAARSALINLSCYLFR